MEGAWIVVLIGSFKLQKRTYPFSLKNHGGLLLLGEVCPQNQLSPDQEKLKWFSPEGFHSGRCSLQIKNYTLCNRLLGVHHLLDWGSQMCIQMWLQFNLIVNLSSVLHSFILEGLKDAMFFNSTTYYEVAVERIGM